MDFYGVKPDPDDPRLICDECFIPLQGPENGFYYCGNCGSQSQDVLHAVADEDDLHATGGVASLYNQHLHRKSQPLPPPLIKPITKIEPSEPQDFPGTIPVSPGDLASGIRVRYVGGLQLVLQRQCEALVERFGVSPIIVGLVGTLWLRFVAASRVFDEGWPERVVAESEAAFVAAANDKLDYSKDLPSYLKYCKEIAFAGRIHSSEEEKLIKRLWDVYQGKEGDKKKVDSEKPDTKEKNLRDGSCTITSLVSKESREESRDSPHIDENKPSNKAGFVSKIDAPPGDVALGNMKLDMEEHGFEYLSPRTKLISTGYLHYRRKKADGKLNYVAHTDYYILLRACARLAQVDVRVMHLGVLKLERRLKWTEQQIDSSLR